MAVLDRSEVRRRQTPKRWAGAEPRRRTGLPIWVPWFDHCETPYELGMAHGKEDRADGSKFHYRSGCLMSSEEYADYRQGYGDGWRSEHSPEEFN